MIASYLLRADFEELGVGEEYAEGVIDELRCGQGRRAGDDRPRAARTRRACAADLDAVGERRASTSPRSPGSAAAAGTSVPPASRPTSRSRRSSSSSAASSPMPPRALRPSGLILVDKPAGPVVVPGDRGDPSPHRCAHRPRRHARPVRDRAPARALGRGDPARARGSSVSTSGTSPTSTCARARRPAIPEGEVVEEHEPPRPSRARGAARRSPRRGRAAGPGRVGGEDRRRARLPAAPARARRSRCRFGAHASTRSSCSTYADGVARLDLRVGSGTYVRSIADALGGHCRTLRRLEVGPFSVDDADDERLLPPAEALPFLPAVEVDAEEAAAIRTGRRAGARGHRTLCDGELVAVGRVVMPA